MALHALTTMRRARSQLRSGLSKKETADHIETMQMAYEDARNRAEDLFRQMTELDMNVGTEVPDA
ncbi:hypothetical protein [Rhodococcoides yunnanense]|uniref:hypothetical protein n=1 Tax=Rhodococcoides yunnanense TaxID=278209 RepID=UPI00157CE609|nr:hypothetical protein [Rhodococcus yunnanensis]